MMDSSIAFHSILEIKEKKKELKSQWEYFVGEDQKPQKIRKDIFQSWKRCQNYGVNPHQKQSSVILTNDQLSELIDKSQLYNTSIPILEELKQQTVGTEHLITLCDSNGRIIYLSGKHSLLHKAEKMNFVQGADWSEKIAGSNAIGTSIAAGKPIQVFAYEHFCEGVHPWNCSAAPIKDPFTGQLLGVFDLTGPNGLAQPHSLSLAQNVSNLIQMEMKEKSSHIRQKLLDHYENSLKKYQSNSVILLDAMLNVVLANSNCLSLLQISDWRQLWSQPEISQIKILIFNSNENELELDRYLPSLHLNIRIQSIVFESERIGYILHFEKKQKHTSSQLKYPEIWGDIIGQSEVFKRAIQKAQTSATTDMPILITGESGTGKEQFAQAIHKTSTRNQYPFLTINCGAIPKELISSELFGYEPGVFTGGNPKGKKGIFEKAEGGTLLLDEIGEMPPDLQVHLLRVLQEKEIVRLGSSQPIAIDVRIIAATNKNPDELIKQKELRTDLYFRLNVIDLKLPALRERKDDLPYLYNYFAVKSAKKLNKPVPTFDKQVISYFHNYHWPGNIRQLENTIDHAVLFCKNNHITLSSLPDSLQNLNKLQDQHESSEILTTLEQEEKQKIMQLLMRTNNNISEVARQCGIARTTLYRKMKKYKLQ